MKYSSIFSTVVAILALSGFSTVENRQKTTPDGKIHFINPSFEGPPGESHTPDGWSSKTSGSTPDLLPGAWGIQTPSHSGNVCLGLVTREDGSREDVGQLLTETLKSGTCYTFSMYLAHVPKYVGYNKPTRIRIWGGSTKGAKDVLLTSSPLVDNVAWKEYKFQFAPSQDIRYICFEAYFAPGALFNYKGNILMDDVSPIERCDRA